ncbi:MAG: hypothetical protein ACE37B_24515 [Ilumatobacter sp.]|uniref:hypothetical protein n=1 Tax=Ilumatobacter sp. TaxID=1967498 RepID=UPI00391D5A6E
MKRHRLMAATLATALGLGALGTGHSASARTERVDDVRVVEVGEGGSQFDATMAHNHEKDEFLVVYRNAFGTQNISGVLLDRNGETIAGPNVLVTHASDDNIDNAPPAVAYNPTTNQFVVAFVRSDVAFAGGTEGQAGHVFGRLVSDTGVVAGPEVQISPDFSPNFFCVASYPDVAFDPISEGFVFAYYQSGYSADDPDYCPGVPVGAIHNALLHPTSAGLDPGAIVRVPRPTTEGQFPQLDVETDPTNGNVMVATVIDFEEGAAFLYRPDKTLISDIPLVQTDPAKFFTLPKVANDPGTGNWLVTWRQTRMIETAGLVVDAAGNTVAPISVIAPGLFIVGLAATGDGRFVGVSEKGSLLHLGVDGQLLSADPVDGLRPMGTRDPRAGIRVSASSPPRLVAAGADSSTNDLAVIAADVLPPGSLPLAPARLLETRDGPGLTTIDGRFEGGGTRTAGTELTLQVAGRGGVPDDAAAAHLNIAAAGATRNGFVTAYPCDAPEVPTTSNLNFTAGAAASAAAFVKLSSTGTVCLFVSTDIHLVVDSNGFVPDGGSVTPIVPARLLETRDVPGSTTTDGQFEGIGRVGANSTTPLTVAGRGGVEANAEAVLVNITAVAPSAQNFVTVYPCGEPQPVSANVNAAAGGLANNLALAKIGDGGAICLFSNSATDLVVDVSAFVPERGGLISTVPARFVDTRSGSQTVDGQAQAVGPLTADAEDRFVIRGRDQVPDAASGVMLNVAAIRPDTGGFITLYPCGDRPLAANLNFAAGAIVSNAVFVKLADTGQVCVYSSTRTDISIDVVGYVVDG